MTAYINKLKDKTGDQQLPVTHERAVRDDNGTTLESKMQNLEGAMDKAYVAQSDNGMGRITLKKNIVSGVNTLTQSMMQATNTIFVIQYDFTLGEDITIPANCVLEFDGGSISGNTHTLTFADTYIESPNLPIFDSVVLAGSVLNGMFNAIWIKGSDIGESVNIAATYFKKICLPADNYTFTTPILLDHCSLVEMLGSYTYNGTLTNGMALVKFNECRASYLRFGRLGISNAVSAELSHNDDRTKNIIGVNIDNSANTTLFVQSVTGVNEGIRVSATETNSGDCFIEATTLVKNNIGIRIYQQNDPNFTPGNWQFVNDTNIRVNYCNAQLTGCTTYGVVVAGPAFDNVSYKDPNVVDSYDKCSGVVIEGGDYEGNTVGFYCRNAEIAIENAREEDMTTFIKAVGSLKLQYQPKYTDAIIALSKIDFTECTNFINNGIPAFSNNISYNIESLIYKFSGYDYVCPYNYYILKSAGIHTGSLFYSNVAGIGLIVDTIYTKILRLGRNKKGRFVVAYLDSDNNNITEGKGKPNDDYFLSVDKSYISGSDSYTNIIIIPTDVTKVFIGIPYNDKDSLTILSYGAHVDNNQTALSGTTRPVALPKNVPFFDESLTPAKPIYWNGTDWVDATGTPV